MKNRKTNNISQFSHRVYAALRRVPRGRVTTYAALARAVGQPRACRGAGNALNKNPNPYADTDLPVRSSAAAGRRRAGALLTPCHRVVRSNGKLGGFASGPAKKAKMLRAEGVEIKNGKIDLRRFEYKF